MDTKMIHCSKLLNRSLLFAACLCGSGALARAAVPPTDAQIVEIVITADTAEIGAARLAEAKATDKEVKKFAEHMISNHSKSKVAAENLAKTLNLNLVSSSSTKELKKETGAQLAGLKDSDRANFDRTYMQDQVGDHKDVLKSINATLIPSAHDPQLKALLEQTRSMVEGHLAMAEKILSSLGK
jgi:putative membrane protein